MSNVRREVGEEGEAENRFRRLPDNVVLHILGKLDNVKWLCRCFVVANRFSSLTPLVHTVSFDAKTWNSFSLFGNEEGLGDVELRNFKRIFLDSLIENLIPGGPEHALLCLPQPHFPHLVFHFKHIQYLNIELPSIYDANNAFVFKWGANFNSNPISFTFLAAEYLSKPKEEKDGKETEYEIAWFELGRQMLLASDCDKKAGLWDVTLSFVVQACLMLRSITITDSKNEGVKFCLSGENLVEYRKRSEITEHVKSLEVIASTGAPRQATLWQGYVPILQLPVSGYVMKGVNLLHMNAFAPDAFDGTAMLDDFAEEKGVFSEAVLQILEKHKSRIVIRGK